MKILTNLKSCFPTNQRPNPKLFSVSTLSVICAALALGAALALPGLAQTPAPGAKAQTTTGGEHKKGRSERHPAIHAAIRNLRQAKLDLEKAAHDFGGHRVKAIESINTALKELEAALQFDKK